MEDTFKRTVKLPRYVIKQMALSDETLSHAEREEYAAELPGRVQGVLVNLNNDGKADLLVKGDDGANVTGFWVFRNLGGKYQLVFEARAFVLELRRAYTNGFRDISIEKMSAATLWGVLLKFDGQKYRAVKCWEQELGNPKAKAHYTKCT
jgi:hypothetical protein